MTTSEALNEMNEPITCVISGATDGIGLVTARELAIRGWTLALLGRNPKKIAQASETLRAAAPQAVFRFYEADLSQRGDVERVGRVIATDHPRIDRLVNNAGALFAKHRLTDDGIEQTLALNHFGYVILTWHLMDALRKSPTARIVNVGSRAHRGPRFDFDNYNRTEGAFAARRAYQQSKLANLLFTFALAKRLSASADTQHITCNTLHPGFVSTNFGMNNGWLVRMVVKWLMLTSAIDVEAGAKTQIYLAADPSVAATTGEYFVDCKAATPDDNALDAGDAERLWALSESITGLAWTEKLTPSAR